MFEFLVKHILVHCYARQLKQQDVNPANRTTLNGILALNEGYKQLKSCPVIAYCTCCLHKLPI